PLTTRRLIVTSHWFYVIHMESPARRNKILVLASCYKTWLPRYDALANRFASSAARNSALALSTHSCCSDFGLESATMPAPAWTYILPLRISAVRSTMQLSSSPAAEK